MRRPKRIYSDTERAAAVVAYEQGIAEGLSEAKAAEIAGVPVSTARSWSKGERRAVACQDPELRREAADRLREACEGIAERAAGIVAERLEQDPDKISFRDLTVAFGVGVDKTVALGQERREDARLKLDVAKLPAAARNLLLEAMGLAYDAEETRALPARTTVTVDAEFREITEGAESTTGA